MAEINEVKTSVERGTEKFIQALTLSFERWHHAMQKSLEDLKNLSQQYEQVGEKLKAIPKPEAVEIHREHEETPSKPDLPSLQ